MAKRKAGSRAAYGGGSVYPNKDGTFTAQVRDGARTIRRRAATRADAERVLADLNKLKASGINIRDGSQPFQDFTDYWFPEVFCQREIKPRTAEHTLFILERYILPTLATRALLSISQAELQTLLNDLRRRKPPLSAQTVQHVRRVLREVFSKALEMQLLRADPAAGLEAPKIRRAERAALETADVRRLLETVGGARHGAALWLMALLGVRVGEALALRRQDCSADFSEVTINEALDFRTGQAGTPKNGRSRALPVPPHVAAQLAAQWAHTKALMHDTPGWNARGLLFPSEAGTPLQPRNFERRWAGGKQRGVMYGGFKQAAGLPDSTTLHDLRRFVATALEDLDVPQRTIGHILGHDAKNVTETYIKRRMPTMRRALEKLEAAIFESQADAKTA